MLELFEEYTGMLSEKWVYVDDEWPTKAGKYKVKGVGDKEIDGFYDEKHEGFLDKKGNPIYVYQWKKS